MLVENKLIMFKIIFKLRFQYLKFLDIINYAVMENIYLKVRYSIITCLILFFYC